MPVSRQLPALILGVLLCSSASSNAEEIEASGNAYVPSEANLQARQWFQDARFGLFIHWGVYSVLGDGEWVMQVREIPAATYEKLPPLFNPTAFDPAEWVGLAKAAGMRYITITAKHHDGFAMFDSEVSAYDIVDSTPYGRDVLALLAKECERQGIRLFVYYSQLDWHHPDYYPRGQTGHSSGRPDSGSWSRYLDYMDAQLTELLTGYGKLGGVWFDGLWDKPDADWRLRQTYDLIHTLQPQALIGSNHHQEPAPGEDFQMFEKDLPGHNESGYSDGVEVSALPLETCETINGSWGFNLLDRGLKSRAELVRYLVRAAGYNANLLLNVGPMPNGRIQPEFIERLRQVGQWLELYGESIYGTRGGPVSPRPWGVTTQKGDRVFVHVLDWRDSSLLLPPLSTPVLSARQLTDGSSVDFESDRDGLLLRLPPRTPDTIDQVIVLELDRALEFTGPDGLPARR